MAKRKSSGRRQQGIVSWLRGVIALFLALYHPLKLLFDGQVETFTYEASMGMTTGEFDKNAALTMYGPMIGALMFHVISGELTKRAKVRSIIPALRA